MIPGPTILKACNKCDGLSWTSRPGSTNTFGARVWPDGKIEAPMRPESHWLVICGHCLQPIWIDQTKEIDGYWGYKQLSYLGYKRLSGADKSWNKRTWQRCRPRSIDDFDDIYEKYDFVNDNHERTWEEQTDYDDKRRKAYFAYVNNLKEKYQNTKEYKIVSVNELEDLLDQNVLSLEKELYVRLSLMRLYNDLNRDNPTPQPSTENQYANWVQLINLLSYESTSVRQKIKNDFLIAEIYREMGKFQEALETINKWQFEKLDDYFENEKVRKSRLLILCKNQDNRIIATNEF